MASGGMGSSGPLDTLYINIEVNTAGMLTQIRSALGQANRLMNSQGLQMGRGLSTAITAGIGVIAVGGIAQIGKEIAGMALQADNARISLAVWARTVKDAGLNLGEADARIAKLSDTLKVSKLSLQENAANLLRMGYSIEQIDAAFTIAAASGVRVRRTTTDSVNAVTMALQSHNSRMLNAIGISMNLGDAYKLYAQQLGRTKASLTEVEQKQADIALLQRDSGKEVAFLAQTLGGLTGKLSDNAMAVEQLRISLGTYLIPVVNNVLGVFNSGVKAFADWAQGSKSAKDAGESLSKGFDTLVSAASTVGLAIKNIYTVAKPGLDSLLDLIKAVFDGAKTLGTNFVNYAPVIVDAIALIGAAFVAVKGQAILAYGAMVSGAVLTFLSQTLPIAIYNLAGALTALSTINVFGLILTAAAALKLVLDNLSAQIDTIYDDIERRNKDIDDQIAKRVAELKKGPESDQLTARKITLSVARAEKVARGEDTTEIDKEILKLGQKQLATKKEELAITKQQVALLGGTSFKSLVAQLGGNLPVSRLQAMGAHPEKYRLTGGKGHPGIDYEIGSGPNGGELGAPVYVPNSFVGGVVTRADNKKSGYGNSVEIQLANGYKVMLGHFQALGVAAGQTLTKGMILGAQGNTGWGFGPKGSGEGKGPVHVHLELRDPKGGIVFDQKKFESILSGGNTTGKDKDPEFDKLVAKLVGLEREKLAASKYLQKNPLSKEALERYEKATKAEENAKTNSKQFADKDLYDRAMAATKDILANEKEITTLNSARVSKFLPEAVSLLTKMQQLEGDTGVVSKENLKAYTELKNRMTAISKDDDGAAALDLAQKQIDAGKQNVSLTSAMADEALRLARNLKAAEVNKLTDPKTWAAASDAFSKFTAKGPSQALAGQWAQDTVAKDRGASFESQLDKANKLTKDLYVAQQMAFGPSRTKAIDDATRAIKEFSDGSKNAALAVQYASDKFEKLQGVTDYQKTRQRTVALPLNSDKQLADKLAEAFKQQDVEQITAIQGEIDKRQDKAKEERKKFIEKLTKAAEDSTDGPVFGGVITSNTQLFKQIEAIKAKYKANPLLTLTDDAELQFIFTKLARLAKEHQGEVGGQLFGTLSDDLKETIADLKTQTERNTKLGTPQNDRANRLSAITANQGIFDQVGKLSQEYKDNPILSLVDSKELTDMYTLLDKLAKQPGGEIFNSLKEGLASTVKEAQAAGTQLLAESKLIAEGNADSIQEAATIAIDSTKDELDALKQDLESNPTLIFSQATIDQIDSLKARLGYFKEESTYYDSKTVSGLLTALDEVTTKATKAGAEIQKSMDIEAIQNGLLTQLLNTQLAFDTLKDKVKNDPLTPLIDNKEMDDLENNLEALSKAFPDSIDVKSLKDDFLDWKKTAIDAMNDVAAKGKDIQRDGSEGFQGTDRPKMLANDLDDATSKVDEFFAKLKDAPEITLITDGEYDRLKLILNRINEADPLNKPATKLLERLDKGYKAAQDLDASNKENEAAGEKAANRTATSNRINSELDQAKTDVQNMLDQLEQFPGISLLSNSDLDFLRVQLQRLMDVDPSGLAKSLSESLDKGYKAAQDAAKQRDQQDAEQNAQYEKEAAKDVARDINEAADNLVEAFRSTGDVEQFLQDSKNLRIYIDGQDLKGIDKNVDDVLNSVATKLTNVDKQIGELGANRIGQIKEELAQNEALYANKLIGDRDYYTNRRKLQLESLELQNKDAKDGLAKQLSQDLITQDDYYSKLGDLKKSQDIGKQQIDLDFKLPKIISAGGALQMLLSSLKELGDPNKVKNINDLYDGLVPLQDSLKKFKDSGQIELLNPNQKEQLDKLQTGVDTLAKKVEDYDNGLIGFDGLTKLDDNLKDVTEQSDLFAQTIDDWNLGNISADQFVQQLTNIQTALEAIADDPNLSDEARNMLNDRSASIADLLPKFGDAASQAKSFGKALNDLEKDAEDLLDANARGAISAADFGEQLAKLQGRKARLDKSPSKTAFFDDRLNNLGSQLTDVVPNDVNEYVDELTMSFLNLSDGVDTLTKAYADGAMTSDEYSKAIGDTGVNTKEYAKSLLDLADAYQAIADNPYTQSNIAEQAKEQALFFANAAKTVYDGGEKAKEESKKLGQKIGKALSDASGSISSGLQGFASAFKLGLASLGAYLESDAGTEGKRILDGAAAFIGTLGEVFTTGIDYMDAAIGKFANAFKNAISAFAKGDWIGGILAGVAGVVDGIVSIVNGAAQSLADAQKSVADTIKDFKFVDVSQMVKVETNYTGGWRDLFGPVSKTTFDEVGLAIAKTFEDGVSSGIEAGMKGFLNGDADWMDQIGEAMRDTIQNAIIQAVVEGGIIQGLLAPILGRLSAAVASGDQGAIASTIGELKAAMPQVQELITTTLEPIKGIIDDAFPKATEAGPIDGSLEAMNKELDDLRDSYAKAATEQERQQLAVQIKDLEQKIDLTDVLGKDGSTDKKDEKDKYKIGDILPGPNIIQSIEKKIKELKDHFKEALTFDDKQRTQEELESWTARLAEIKGNAIAKIPKIQDNQIRQTPEQMGMIPPDSKVIPGTGGIQDNQIRPLPGVQIGVPKSVTNAKTPTQTVKTPTISQGELMMKSVDAFGSHVGDFGKHVRMIYDSAVIFQSATGSTKKDWSGISKR